MLSVYTVQHVCLCRSSPGSCAVWTSQLGSVRWWRHAISLTPMTSDTWCCGSQHFWYTLCRLFLIKNTLKSTYFFFFFSNCSFLITLLIYIPAGWRRKPCTEGTDLPLQQHRLLLPSLQSWPLAGKSLSHSHTHTNLPVTLLWFITRHSGLGWLSSH